MSKSTMIHHEIYECGYQFPRSELAAAERKEVAWKV